MGIKIVAELAQGFEGRPEQARLLLNAAASAGADSAKFQLVYADELATPDYKYYDLFRTLEMGESIWSELMAYARELNIQLEFDIFGEKSLALAVELGISGIKLHGTDIANAGLLHQVAQSPIKNIMLGAGGAYLAEIRQAIGILEKKNITVLLGFQGYPTPLESNQIERVRIMTDLFADKPHIDIGFADHASPDDTLRYALPAMAVGAGATVLEKHLTLGRCMKLEDHESALNPDEFLEFSQTMRGCALALGMASESEDFGMSDAEQKYRNTIRRHVVAGRDIKTGTVVGPADLTLKRTSSVDVMTNLSSVYGQKIKRDISANSPILPTDI